MCQQIFAFTSAIEKAGKAVLCNRANGENYIVRTAHALKWAFSFYSLQRANDFILDSGAAKHVVATDVYLERTRPNQLYQLVGVGGQANCRSIGYLSVTFDGFKINSRKVRLRKTTIRLESDPKKAPGALYCPRSPVNIISLSVMLERGWKMSENCDYIWHPKKLLLLPLTQQRGLFYLKKSSGSPEEAQRVVANVRAEPRRISFAKAWNSALRWYVVFGGPDLAKLRRTSDIAGLKLAGTIPGRIKEFVAAKMQRNYPKPDPPTEYKPFECVTWDMITFKTRSAKCRFSHNAVDRALKMRFAYPVERADTDSFLAVLTQFLAFIGRQPKVMVLQVVRTDAGTNYTDVRVRNFLQQRGITMQIASVATPHQIAQGERNHGVLLPTMRAIMAFAGASNKLWAFAIRYAAVLCNHMATDYNTQQAFIPWMKIVQKLDWPSLLPFGCQVTKFVSKQDAEDGKASPRGVVGVFVGVGIFEGRKAILVLTPDEKVSDTVFFVADETYFPLRPRGQRRFLPTGVFGDEGETAQMFNLPPFDPNALIEGESTLEGEHDDTSHERPERAGTSDDQNTRHGATGDGGTGDGASDGRHHG